MVCGEVTGIKFNPSTDRNEQDHRSVFSEARRIQGSCHAKMFEVRDEPVSTTAAMPTLTRARPEWQHARHKIRAELIDLAKPKKMRVQLKPPHPPEIKQNCYENSQILISKILNEGGHIYNSKLLNCERVSFSDHLSLSMPNNPSQKKYDAFWIPFLLRGGFTMFHHVLAI